MRFYSLRDICRHCVPITRLSSTRKASSLDAFPRTVSDLFSTMTSVHAERLSLSLRTLSPTHLPPHQVHRPFLVSTNTVDLRIVKTLFLWLERSSLERQDVVRNFHTHLMRLPPHFDTGTFARSLLCESARSQLPAFVFVSKD